MTKDIMLRISGVQFPDGEENSEEMGSDALPAATLKKTAAIISSTMKYRKIPMK